MPEKSEAYDGREVANFVLDYLAAKNRLVTNLELQKIVYFCHAWTLVKLERPLIRHEFEAWEYGPVLPYLYRDFKIHGDMSIESRAVRIDLQDGSKVQAWADFSIEVSDLLKTVADFYSPLQAYQLVELSHEVGGPWHQVWAHKSKINPGMKIPNESISSFYSIAWGYTRQS